MDGTEIMDLSSIVLGRIEDVNRRRKKTSFFERRLLYNRKISMTGGLS